MGAGGVRAVSTARGDSLAAAWLSPLPSNCRNSATREGTRGHNAERTGTGIFANYRSLAGQTRDVAHLCENARWRIQILLRPPDHASFSGAKNRPGLSGANRLPRRCLVSALARVAAPSGPKDARRYPRFRHAHVDRSEPLPNARRSLMASDDASNGSRHTSGGGRAAREAQRVAVEHRAAGQRGELRRSDR